MAEHHRRTPLPKASEQREGPLRREALVEAGGGGGVGGKHRHKGKGGGPRIGRGALGERRSLRRVKPTMSANSTATWRCAGAPNSAEGPWARASATSGDT